MSVRREGDDGRIVLEQTIAIETISGDFIETRVGARCDGEWSERRYGRWGRGTNKE